MAQADTVVTVTLEGIATAQHPEIQRRLKELLNGAFVIGYIRSSGGITPTALSVDVKPKPR